MSEKKESWIGALAAMVVMAAFIIFVARGLMRRYPNPENFRPIGTVAHVINAQVWADGHWYALASTNWSGADLLKLAPDDFAPGTNPRKRVMSCVALVQRENGWAILPDSPPH